MSPRRLLALLTAILLGCGRSPQHDFEAGTTCFQAGKFAKAEACFARAIAGSVPTAQAFSFLGVCQLYEGKTDTAIQSFQEALKLDPHHAAAQRNLALAFLEAGKPDDAIPLLRQLPDAQVELGRAYLRASAWGQARQVLQKCAATADTLNALGVATARLGNHREAREHFEHCLSLAPDFAAAHLNLAILEHRHLGDKAAAVKHYRRFLELDSRRDDVRQLVAQLEQELAPGPKPVETASAVAPPQPPPKPPEPAPSAPPLQPPPAPAPPKPNVASAPPAPAPSVKRRVPVAAQTLKAGNRARAQISFNEGVALQQQGKLAEAIASYQRAIAADPSFANAYYNLAIAYRDALQPARALDNYELALRANPKFTSARINYAILLQQEGYLPDAIAQYEQLLQENPNDASLHLTVGTLYARDRAMRDKARQHYLAFLKLAPNSPAARDIRRWLDQNP